MSRLHALPTSESDAACEEPPAGELSGQRIALAKGDIDEQPYLRHKESSPALLPWLQLGVGFPSPVIGEVDSRKKFGIGGKRAIEPMHAY